MANPNSSLRRLSQWRIGLSIILLLITLRLLGLSSPLEFLAFDRFLAFLYASKQEAESSRITLINLDQDFIDSLTEETGDSFDSGNIPETSLRELLQKLIQHRPAVVGLDIVSDRISPTEEQQLAQIINQNAAIVTVEKVLDPTVPPLSNLSTDAHRKQIAANDFPADKDGTVRRAFLGFSTQKKEFRPSLSLRLADIYLENQHDIEIKNGLKDPDTVRFNPRTKNDSIEPKTIQSTLLEVPRLRTNSGAYRREDNIYELQTLLNFRRRPEAFPVISANSVLEGKVEPALVRDRILIIGITAPSLASYSLTPLEISQFSKVPSQAVGIELQAHATSQIIAAVLENRPLLRIFSPPVEYVLIVGAGLLAIGMGRLSNSTARNLLSLGGVLLLLLILSLVTMYYWGWWLPIAPSFLVLSINGVAYIAYYQNERSWKRLIEERDRVISERNLALEERNKAIQDLKSERRTTIETAINEIHNGPLQTLALLIRRSQSPQTEATEFHTDLQQLDKEIRGLGEELHQAAMANSISLGLGNGQRLDATYLSLHELLYSVFDITLSRNFPGLATLRLSLRDFEPYPGELPPELKRDIGHFLAEALCNVGKHAITATRLEAIGQRSEQRYCLTVSDNGALAADHPLILHKGTGTQQAETLARQLGGQFNRKARSPHGVICELSWPLPNNESRQASL